MQGHAVCVCGEDCVSLGRLHACLQGIPFAWSSVGHLHPTPARMAFASLAQQGPSVVGAAVVHDNHFHRHASPLSFKHRGQQAFGKCLHPRRFVAHACQHRHGTGRGRKRLWFWGSRGVPTPGPPQLDACPDQRANHAKGLSGSPRTGQSNALRPPLAIPGSRSLRPTATHPAGGWFRTRLVQSPCGRHRP